MSIRIETSEFEGRIDRIQAELERRQLDALIVYGDEYRKENLRYVTNFWPIFERGACFIPRKGRPILAGAPEGEVYAREMCVWKDVRNVKEFACVSVPEEIDYPQAKFSTFSAILGEVLAGGKKAGLVGLWDMPGPIYRRIEKAAPGLELVDGAEILQQLRIIKSPAEIACLREAGRQACLGYEKLIAACVPGNTERQAAGIAEGAARAAGAEDINFMVFGSGPRVDTVIGRATNRVMQDGDMLMAAMAVQYEGYVATVEYPFVVGRASDKQKHLLAVLFEAANEQLKHLKDGADAGGMVRAVQAVFAKHDMTRYDLYPPMHGIGLAEAESPYPNADATYQMKSGMCVNSDVSLWGTPGGSNRIEEGFVITAAGPESLTPALRKLVERGIA